MKTSRKTVLMIIAIILLAGLVTSCIPGDGKNTPEEPAGFFWGIWHGWVAPISLIVSIFKPGISIYEANNSGFWYDLGFYMAIISGFGGLGLARKKQHQHHKGKRDRYEE